MTSTPLTIVAKIGTSSITNEAGTIDRAPIKKLCAEVAALRAAGNQVVIVTSGAIAAGLPELGLENERHRTDSQTLQAVATVGQCALIGVYREVLQRHDLVAGQVLLVPLDFVIRAQYVHAGTTLQRLLELGVVPVVNENDAVADDEIRWGDNDRIAALVANLVKADLLVLLTDTPGVYTDDPRRNPDAALLEEITDIDDRIANTSHSAGTKRGSGGMLSKLTAARVASRSGVTTLIAAADRPNILPDAITHFSAQQSASEQSVTAPIGTFIPASAIRMSARKLWIGFAVSAEGQIVVDDGARKALEAGKSLLAVGAKSVQGNFDAGAPVEIITESGDVFAKGLARHPSREIQIPQDLKAEAVSTPNILVHANDLVLLTD